MALLTGTLGCAALRETAALRQVEFHFDRVSDAEVARIRLDRLLAFRDLGVAEVARLGLAVASRDVPFEVTVHVTGTNPVSNQVTARMIALDWEYVVDERQIITGTLERELRFAPGEPVDVPVAVGFNLARAFEGDARTLFETAVALSGQGPSSHDVVLRIRPTIDTPIGPIQYPTPISIRLASAGDSH